MPKVVFTPHLKLHLNCPDTVVDGSTLMEALENVFADNSKLRGYVLDDQGRMRQHVVVFIDGQVASDRVKLSDSVSAGSEIYVMQALSGG